MRYEINNLLASKKFSVRERQPSNFTLKQYLLLLCEAEGHKNTLLQFRQHKVYTEEINRAK
jgi:hypothetical protein